MHLVVEGNSSGGGISSLISGLSLAAVVLEQQWFVVHALGGFGRR
jgi:hypothetical protein